MRTLLIAVIAASFLAATGTAEAGGRRQRLMERPADAAAPSIRAREPGANARAAQARYPKFQGGFHARELQNIGVPTGDQGMRGNGFSMYAW